MPVHLIAYISEAVTNALGLACAPGTPVFLGDSNTAHMRARHADDYAAHAHEMADIINNPEYVALNPRNGSIEFVKYNAVADAYIKVAVRASSSGAYFARSMYRLNTNRVKNFIAKGFLKKL